MVYLEDKVAAHDREISELKEILLQLRKQVDKVPEKTFSVQQTADQLGITTATVNYHLRNGNLVSVPGKKRCKKITESEIIKFKNNNGANRQA